MKLLITNINQLLQAENHSINFAKEERMSQLPMVENAYLLIQDDKIIDFGSMDDIPNISAETTINASGRVVLPAWCDSHTHLVYAGNRVQEFVDRINGLSYEEIAKNGGGILNSAKKLQQCSEDELYEQSAERLKEIMKLGTGAVEIKSGYGLTTESELKMLRVIKRLNEDFPIAIKATFLGAHAVPSKFKNNKDGYMDIILNEMLPVVAAERLADYVDIFCEEGYFSVEDTKRLLEAASNYGLTAKTHVNQFNAIGGVKASTTFNARSVDHLEVLNENDIDALKDSETMPVALPSCSYFLSIPYTPGRKLIDAGLPLALATDFNPGSTPSGNMNFVVATACIKMKLTPEESINAATINGAYAMGLEKTHGSISKGKQANFIITKEIPNFYSLPYNFGSNLIDKVFINGKEV